MATTFSNLVASILVRVRSTATKTIDFGTPESIVNLTPGVSFTFGAGAGNANMVWSDRRALAKATADNLDLYGSLTDAFGITINFSAVKAIVIHNRSDEADTPTDATLTIGNGSNPFVGPFGGTGTHTVTLPAGGILVLACDTADGWAVATGTGDILKVNNDDADDAAEYDIWIIGESA